MAECSHRCLCRTPFECNYRSVLFERRKNNHNKQYKNIPDEVSSVLSTEARVKRREQLLIERSKTTANHREAVEYAFEAARLFEEKLKDTQL